MKLPTRHLILASSLFTTALLLGACARPENRPAALKDLEMNRWSQLFKMVDANGDGKISRVEFQANYTHVTWMYFDKNGDGVITASEWSIDGVSEERRDWFKGLDEDGDGQITRAEFERAVSPEGVDYFFKLMDKDGSEYFTMKDLGIY